MNYNKIYYKIIKNARCREYTNGYHEKHHIIPKCMGGNNNAENIVKLTAKEHYIAHKLLVKIYPENENLYFALFAMCNLISRNTKNRYIVSSRQYEEVKKNVSLIIKNKLKIYNPWNGKKHKESSIIKMSNSAKSRNISNEMESKRRSGISKSNKKPKSASHSENIRKAKIGEKNPMFGKFGKEHHNSKPVIQYNLDMIKIMEWENAKIAANDLNLSYKAINQNCNNRTKTSGGFIWKFK